MATVRIYGAGSIGNHLANICRSKCWNVTVCDVDSSALERTKTSIYPGRYGEWDEEISLKLVKDLEPEDLDLVIIGTPPDTHLKIAIKTLKENPPKAMLIEKPLCTPSLDKCDEFVDLVKTRDIFVAVGYNHSLTSNTIVAKKLINDGYLKDPVTISAGFREHWGGIFDAHPWLDGPGDSYLGCSNRGGGASGEHSHAIHIWQYFSHLLGMGKIVEVSAMMDRIDDGNIGYDAVCQISVKTENGIMGHIVQDVVTEPSQKYLRVQATNGFLEWYVNSGKNEDSLRYWDGYGEVNEEIILKTRPDDFKCEIDHLELILNGKDIDSPISLERGLETMMVLAAAHVSNSHKKTVKINYEAGYCLDAIRINN